LLAIRENFIERYNKIRPKAETTFSSLKRMIARWLKSRMKNMQKKEAYMCVIVYNVVRAVINLVRLIRNRANELTKLKY